MASSGRMAYPFALRKNKSREIGRRAHWNGLARDRAGRLDVSAGRLALVAILSGVEVLINPMPIHQMTT
jgi:hypothetical protein